MPSESHFLPKHHLLYERMYGVVTPEEISGQQAKDVRFLAVLEKPIHILVDLRALEVSHHHTLSEMKNVLAPMDPTKLQWIIFVVPKDNPILPFFVSVTTQIATKGGRIKTVTSLEEAFEFLAVRDLTLDLKALGLEIEKYQTPAPEPERIFAAKAERDAFV